MNCRIDAKGKQAHPGNAQNGPGRAGRDPAKGNYRKRLQRQQGPFWKI